MAARSKDGLSPPMNVEQIVKKAQSFDYNPLIPLKYWLRTAGTLLKEAEIYEHEGNDQQTYLLLFRHAQLVLGNLVRHPGSQDPANRIALQQAESTVRDTLQKLEILKPRINRRHERYAQLMQERDARKAREGSQTPRSGSASSTTGYGHGRQLSLSDPAVTGSTETLTAGENKELAVRLAHKEIKRRTIARKATRQAGISEEEEQERRTGGVWGNWEEAFTKDDLGVDRDTLSRQMQNVRLQVDGSKQNGRPTGESRASYASSTYRYPSIPEKHDFQKSPFDPQGPRTTKDGSTDDFMKALQAPAVPPKDPNVQSYRHIPPTKPEKYPLPPIDVSPTKSQKSLLSPNGVLSPSKPDKVPFSPIIGGPTRSEAKPDPRNDLKPSTFTFKPSAYLENGSPLRTIFLPPDLRKEFLKIAEPNTRANLETCGTLVGTLISNALFISKLVIPEQISTSDTCETVNEMALFDYVDGEDLMVLGWIHTHPTQTCFMSSRDLHTHCGYQVMMPESIAIVCAPSKNDWGVFRLTDPPGMKSVLNCTQTGIFHPHDFSNIYTDALRPSAGHCFEAKGLEFDVVDLRPGH
ncbi:hypothetical protein MMC09_002448 [Bachmanniomyces sp. S44760]|nr:hypothetical protein [Bachmanniomyces sp. S44760]